MKMEVARNVFSPIGYTFKGSRLLDNLIDRFKSINRFVYMGFFIAERILLIVARAHVPATKTNHGIRAFSLMQNFDFVFS